MCQELKKKLKYSFTVHLFINLKEASDSVRREDVCIIFIECGPPRKLVQLMKMCLNGTCNKVHIDEHLCDVYVVRTGHIKSLKLHTNAPTCAQVTIKS
jgi:hypothetical protein